MVPYGQEMTCSHCLYGAGMRTIVHEAVEVTDAPERLVGLVEDEVADARVFLEQMRAVPVAGSSCIRSR